MGAHRGRRQPPASIASYGEGGRADASAGLRTIGESRFDGEHAHPAAELQRIGEVRGEVVLKLLGP